MGGLNTYAYVDNDVLSDIDPYGLSRLLPRRGRQGYGYGQQPLRWMTPAQRRAQINRQEWLRREREINRAFRECNSNSTHIFRRMEGNSINGYRHNEFLYQLMKYGGAGVRPLQNGRYRFYGDITPARTPGEMAGRRTVREWSSRTFNKRTWQETIDHSGNIRQVRPQREDNVKIHYRFNQCGCYEGKW